MTVLVSDTSNVSVLTAGPEPTVRRLRFDFRGDFSPDWHPRLPEFAAGANAISLLMPHAEPFVISAVRDAAATVDDPDLRDRAEKWASQEAVHFKAHRAFNKAMRRHHGAAPALDRAGAFMFSRLRTRSTEFRVAFAAAFELVAFASARWAESGLRRYFDGADETAASLFLWHLAEEVEHKGVAHDVFQATNGASRKYPLAAIVAFVTLIGFTVVGGIALFATRRPALNPLRWLRLIGWGFSLAFVLVPIMIVSVSRKFHPDQLVDPPWLAQWLNEYDPVTDTLPLWTDAGSIGRPNPTLK